eukprot:g23425.t1
MAMAGGAAAGGGLAFMMCAAKCPGGVGGALSGMIGAMNPFSMLMKKDEMLGTSHGGLLGGAAGAAAGKVAANQMNKQDRHVEFGRFENQELR